MQSSKTANYKAVADQAGHRFLFYCQISGAHVRITKEIYPGQLEEALGLAWKEEGCWRFNQCRRCGKWVIDAVFNTEVLECVECAPYESEPKFCKTCGMKIRKPARCCQHCGNKLIYAGVEEHHAPETSFKKLEKFGFGPNVMKKNKVCLRCGRLVGTRLLVCPDCNEKLSSETLFDRYKRRHLSCSRCDTILTPGSRYCPTCGKSVMAKAVGSNAP